jgi:hypothetical protein
MPRPALLLRRAGIAGIMRTLLPGIPMSATVQTATVLTSARMAAGMTSRARRPVDGHPAG